MFACAPGADTAWLKGGFAVCADDQKCLPAAHMPKQMHRIFAKHYFQKLWKHARASTTAAFSDVLMCALRPKACGLANVARNAIWRSNQAESPTLPLLRTLRAHVEDTTLAVLLVVAGAMWAFVAIASEMLEGDLDAFDETILLGLRNPADLADPIGPRALEIVMRDLTALGGVTVLSLLTFSVIVMLLLRRQTGSAAVVAVAVLGGQIISHLSKFGFSRPRPDLVPHGVDVATSSFPSGHSMMAAVTYLTLGVMLARLEPRRRVKTFYLVLAIILTLLVGTSRVFLGVHWPSDVLAGWAAGAAWALTWSLIAQALARRGNIEPNNDAG